MNNETKDDDVVIRPYKKPLKRGIVPPEENQVVAISCFGKKMDFATTYQGVSYYIWLYEGKEIQVNYLDEGVEGSKDILVKLSEK
jgi:hypothetical protein